MHDPFTREDLKQDRVCQRGLDGADHLRSLCLTFTHTVEVPEEDGVENGIEGPQFKGQSETVGQAISMLSCGSAQPGGQGL